MTNTQAPVSDDYLILLVDDEPHILSSLQRVLHREVYRIITASSGQQALDLLADISGKGLTVSIVVSDFRMPGMNGIELLTSVRSLYPATVRLILSGYVDAETVQSAINDGHVYKFMAKPWDDDEFKAVLRSSAKLYDEVRQTRMVLGSFGALQAEAEKVGLTLQPSRRWLASAELAGLFPLSETTTRYEMEALRVWQHVVNSIPVAIIGVGSDELIVLSNPYVEELFHFNQWAILGTTISESLPSEMVRLVRSVLTGDSNRAAANVVVQERPVIVECVPLLRSAECEARGALLVAFVLGEPGRT